MDIKLRFLGAAQNVTGSRYLLDELLRWLSGLETPPRHVFVTHGEPEAAAHFAGVLRAQKGWEVSVPQYEEEVVLE